MRQCIIAYYYEKLLRDKLERQSDLLSGDKISSYEKKFHTGMLNGEAIARRFCGIALHFPGRVHILKLR